MVAPAVEFSSQLPNDCESHKMIAAWINREREDASNHRLKQAQHSDGLYFSTPPPPIIYLCVGGDGRMADLDRGLDVIPVFSRTCDDQPRMTIGAPRRYTVYFVIDDVRTALRPDDLGHKQTSHFSASLSPGLLARVIVYQFSLPLLGQCRLVSSCSKLILFTRIICIL